MDTLVPASDTRRALGGAKCWCCGCMQKVGDPKFGLVPGTRCTRGCGHNGWCLIVPGSAKNHFGAPCPQLPSTYAALSFRFERVSTAGQWDRRRCVKERDPTGHDIPIHTHAHHWRKAEKPATLQETARVDVSVPMGNLVGGVAILGTGTGCQNRANHAARLNTSTTEYSYHDAKSLRRLSAVGPREYLGT